MSVQLSKVTITVLIFFPGCGCLHIDHLGHPFVDVINTMLDETLPLTVGEFEEWGNPKEKAAYEYIRSYCPYTNLTPGDYPAMLVRTSFNDSPVMYWEPAKYVARLRTVKTDKNPLLLEINMDAGQAGAAARFETETYATTSAAHLLWRRRQRGGARRGTRRACACSALTRATAAT